MVFLDTLFHVDAVTNSNKLLWHTYLRRQWSKNSYLYNPLASLCPALDNMNVVTELEVGLCSGEHPYWCEVCN
jgi:hypothetical protein